MPTIDPMQQEAMRRVQAMQSRMNQNRTQRTQNAPKPQRTQNAAEPQRTQSAAEHQNTQAVSDSQENKAEHNKEAKIPPDIKKTNTVQSQNIISNNISPVDILLKDKEQNLILLLIVLLAGDGANQNLLLALIYLLI